MRYVLNANGSTSAAPARKAPGDGNARRDRLALVPGAVAKTPAIRPEPWSQLSPVGMVLAWLPVSGAYLSGLPDAVTNTMATATANTAFNILRSLCKFPDICFGDASGTEKQLQILPYLGAPVCAWVGHLRALFGHASWPFFPEEEWRWRRTAGQILWVMYQKRCSRIETES